MERGGGRGGWWMKNEEEKMRRWEEEFIHGRIAQKTTHLGKGKKKKRIDYCSCSFPQKLIYRRYLSVVLPVDSRESSRVTLPSAYAPTLPEYSLRNKQPRKQKKIPMRGLEPRSSAWEAPVITTYTTSDNKRLGLYSGEFAAVPQRENIPLVLAIFLRLCRRRVLFWD